MQEGQQIGLFNRLPDKPFLTTKKFQDYIIHFHDFGKQTEILDFPNREYAIPVYVNEFWTSKQRAAHSLHEISYRACFKPQLPNFFITHLTRENEVVYDPFMGRGTTVIETALLSRIPMGCDINPLSRILTAPRLNPPDLTEIDMRLQQIDLEKPIDTWEQLLVFYHPLTLKALTNLRAYILHRVEENKNDPIDSWIRMVATNRLTGHSPGFFSVYTLPPNQAVTIPSQEKINKKREQRPPVRDVRALILRKSRSLLKKIRARDIDMLRQQRKKTLLITGSSEHTPSIEDASVSLVVTSPPFLDVVNYQKDNWLRCWFNDIDSKNVRIWQINKPDMWREKMSHVFQELKRILVPGGHVAFEVGEVRGGKILLETLVVPAAVAAGLEPCMIIVNSQTFTKTSNCWGVDNLQKGTNTNRIVLLRRPEYH